MDGEMRKYLCVRIYDRNFKIAAMLCKVYIKSDKSPYLFTTEQRIHKTLILRTLTIMRRNKRQI